MGLSAPSNFQSPDIYAPPHQRLFLAAEYATTDIDLRTVPSIAAALNVAAQSAPPKAPCCQLAIFFGADGQELTLETVGGQRAKFTATAAGWLVVRGAYVKIIADNNADVPTGSDAESVVVFWQ